MIFIWLVSSHFQVKVNFWPLLCQNTHTIAQARGTRLMTGEWLHNNTSEFVKYTLNTIRRSLWMNLILTGYPVTKLCLVNIWQKFVIPCISQFKMLLKFLIGHVHLHHFPIHKKKSKYLSLIKSFYLSVCLFLKT